jgi:hypothetical protein
MLGSLCIIFIPTLGLLLNNSKLQVSAHWASVVQGSFLQHQLARSKLNFESCNTSVIRVGVLLVYMHLRLLVFN